MPTVMQGPGRLYRAPVGEPNPDESTVDFGEAWGGNWVDMGDFPEGSPITLSMAEEVYKVYSEQLTAPLGVTRTRREAMVKGALLEHTVDNMAIALQGTAETTPAGGGGQKGYSDIPFGAPANVQFYKWGIEAALVDAAGINQPVRWFLHRGFFRMTGDTAYAKTKETSIPFEITVIADLEQAAGEELGQLQIVEAAATAT